MLEPGHPLIGAHQFLAEIRGELTNYADRLSSLADAERDKNRLSGDVSFVGCPRGSVAGGAGRSPEVRPVESHIPKENFKKGQ
jgi:hypothetical protein